MQHHSLRRTACGMHARPADRASASAGQSGLMALYDTLFGMMDLQAAQLLVTPRDFRDETFKVGRCTGTPVPTHLGAGSPPQPGHARLP